VGCPAAGRVGGETGQGGGAGLLREAVLLLVLDMRRGEETHPSSPLPDDLSRVTAQRSLAGLRQKLESTRVSDLLAVRTSQGRILSVLSGIYPQRRTNPDFSPARPPPKRQEARLTIGGPQVAEVALLVLVHLPPLLFAHTPRVTIHKTDQQGVVLMLTGNRCLFGTREAIGKLRGLCWTAHLGQVEGAWRLPLPPCRTRPESVGRGTCAIS
jgi:hypothetical protein